MSDLISTLEGHLDLAMARLQKAKGEIHQFQLSSSSSTAVQDLARAWDSIDPPKYQAITDLHFELIKRAWIHRDLVFRDWLTEKRRGRTPVYLPGEIFDLVDSYPLSQATGLQWRNAGLVMTWVSFVIPSHGQDDVEFKEETVSSGVKERIVKVKTAGVWRGIINEMERLGLLDDLKDWPGW